MNKLLMTSMVLVMVACVASSPPPVVTGTAGPAVGPPVAADNGQPKMHATLDALARAQQALQVATPNKGGHRERAGGCAAQRPAEVQAGIQYADAHANEVGMVEAAAEPEPVNENVAGADNQPHMAQAMVELRE